MISVFDKVDLCIDHIHSSNYPQILDNEIPAAVQVNGNIYAMVTGGIFEMEKDSDIWIPLEKLPFTPMVGSAMTGTDLGLGVFVKDTFWTRTLGEWQPICKIFKSRKFTALCYCPNHNCVIISGGQDDHSRILSEFWIVWLERGEVHELKLSQEIKRYGHTVVWTEGSTVCIFGGRDEHGFANTNPIFVDILTGNVTNMDIFCPFPNLCQHNAMVIANNIYFIGGLMNNKKSRDSWILDIKHRVWFKIELCGWGNAVAGFMFPIDGGFHVFSDNLQQSIKLLYDEYDTFIDKLVQVNIDSQLYKFDEVKATKDQLKRIDDWHKSILNVCMLATTSSNSDQIEDFNSLTTEIANLKRSILAVRSVRGSSAKPASKPVAAVKTNTADLMDVIKRIDELKAANREPVKTDRDSCERLRRGLNRLLKYDKLEPCFAMNRNIEAQVRSQEVAAFLTNQRNQIAQLRSRMHSFPEEMDLVSLVEGGQKHAEMSTELWSTECEVAKTKETFAELRQKIVEKMMELRRKQETLDIKHKHLVDDLVKVANEKNRNERAMKRIQAEQEALFKTIHDCYQQVISNVTRASVHDAQYLTKRAAASMEELILWINEMAAESGNRDCMNTIKTIQAPRPMKVGAVDIIADASDYGWLASTIEALRMGLSS